ncbi:hypothetical protein N0V90_007970 [Kalmusia sp. IMI 367209]|nr:hypothetical protein N0V90_007970 [Kalmusia sp. IMI 367209]
MEETLLDYLRRKNPIIDHISHKSSKSNTRTPTYTRPKWIAKWEGFDTETLQKMYSDILGRVGTRDAVEPKAIDLRVKDETGFSDVVLKWNREVVFQALEEAKQYTGHDEIVYMVRGALAKDPPGATKRYRPDWAAIAWAPHEQASRKLEDNRLPGDTKYSKKWKSAWVEEGECRRMFGPEDDYPTWFWPIAQVFTYCHRLETRYAYIITDEELVLFRVGPNRDSPTPTPKSHRLVIEELVSDGKIEFVSVPWTNGRNEEGSELGEPNGLSINTALWWIHLQAASDSSIQWTYPPLENDVLSPRDDSGHSSGVDT